MKPENRSKYLHSITQAKAKMYEYGVPEEDHIQIIRDPARLFSLTIGMLGDLSAQINNDVFEFEDIIKLENNLDFSARFFDSYFQAQFDYKLNPYLWLLGAASYYLAFRPGNSLLLAKKLENENLNLNAASLDKLALWILLGEYKKFQYESTGPYREIIIKIASEYSNFFINGLNSNDLFISTNELKKLVYQVGTPRQLLFADIISAITKIKYGNSTWKNLPKYSELPVSLWEDILKNEKFQIKELWPAQHIIGIHGVYKGKSAVIQLPTNAGKTKAIELIIRSAFLSNRTSLAIIVAPFRSLCHEICRDLKDTFRSESIFTNELTDINQTDYTIENSIIEKQVLIVTPEKLLYVLKHSPNLGKQIGLIIYDEGHQFDNGIRGVNFELLITSLKEQISNNVQSVLISAVISNGEYIGKWLNGDDTENIIDLGGNQQFRKLAFTDWKDRLGRLIFVNPEDTNLEDFFVPRVLEQFSLQNLNKEYKFPDQNDGKEIALYLGLKIVKNGSVAIFCGTKSTAESICKKIVSAYSDNLPMNKPSYYSIPSEVEKLVLLYELNLGLDSLETKTVKLGIFPHHNNIPHGLRLAIEYALQEGQIKFVICTSTLAQGVNLPIRYLIVTGIYQGKDKIRVRDFQNLIGRTGRAKFHTEGTIIFSDPDVYGLHRNPHANLKWINVNHLIDPIQSEPCESSILAIFNPIDISVVGANFYFNTEEMLEKYDSGYEAMLEIVVNGASYFHHNVEMINQIRNEVLKRFSYIASIESFLLSNIEDSDLIKIGDASKKLAEGTLAYHLADENLKDKISNLFVNIAHKIVNKIPESKDRKVFGRTLLGLDDSYYLFTWLSLHIEEIKIITDEKDLLLFIWPLLDNYIKNSSFRKCSKPEVLKLIIISWINGSPYYKLLIMLVNSDAKYIWGKQLRNYKLSQIVDLCDNCFSFEGVFIIGAVIDILESFEFFECDKQIEILKTLQKKIKYGINSQMSIILYELGFSDRIVASDLSNQFIDIDPKRDQVIRSMKNQYSQVFSILEKYPIYFQKVCNDLIA
jgi:superfamily II DNA/RNA helicase